MELDERLNQLYIDELTRSLRPPAHRLVNRRQTLALIRDAEERGTQILDTPDDRTWIWSDLHLGHTVAIMAFDRPFRNTEKMDWTPMEAWRNNVSADETIVCVGDVSGEGYMHVGHEQMWNSAPGRKWLVLGNHDVDLVNRIATLATERTAVALVAPGDPPLVLTHVPLLEVPFGCVNVHGHVHEKASPPPNRHINVSVEQLDYRPVKMSEIRRLLVCPKNDFTLVDLLKDGIDGSVPRERLRVCIVVSQVVLDGGHQFLDAAEDTAA